MKFWRMTGLIVASPVDIILDKGNYTLEELLDEEEIIQEYRARNARLVNYLRNRAQVEKLLRYIVEEAPEDAEENQIFKFPFIACEIFTCEVDVILNTLVEDDKLMNMLFSFLNPGHPHNTLLTGYFSKVVACLMLRRTATLMNYVQNHQEIVRQLVDLIGITSIMEVLIRLIGADENMYTNYIDEMNWLKDTDVLEMIVDKFSSSDSPRVHANAAEVLCAVIRCAPPGLGAKICSSSFMGKLFRHALEGSRPKSVLVHSLSVCISLLDPMRLVSASYNLFRSQLTQGSLVVANPETVDGMLESLGSLRESVCSDLYSLCFGLQFRINISDSTIWHQLEQFGDLLKLLDVSSAAVFFPTTYGYLKPPFGKHRLKIVEFVSVLLTIGSEAAERELVQRGAIKHILNMFFDYPYNNFLHHTVENIIGLCLESKSAILIEHILQDCDLVGRILGAEKQPLLFVDCSKPTTASRGRLLPRIGSFGHMTHIANKLSRLSNSNKLIQTHLQENKEWVVWHANVLVKRNVIEDVRRWACGRPNVLQDQLRDNDYEGFRDRDSDLVALENNLNKAFSNEGNEEVPLSSSPRPEGQKVYLLDESAEVMSSRNLAEYPDNISLFTNSSWFSYEENRIGKDHAGRSLSLPAPSSDESREIIIGENDNINNPRISLLDSDSNTNVEEPGSLIVENGPMKESEDTKYSSPLNYGEEPGSSIVENGPMNGSEDTRPSSPRNYGEEPGSLITENSPVKESEDTRPSSLLNYGEEPAETIGLRDTSDSNELPDTSLIASSSIHDLKVCEDRLSINETVEPNNKHAHAESESTCADPSTLDFQSLPTPETGNACAAPAEESTHINAILDATPSGEDAGTVDATPPVSQDAKHLQNSVENEGGW